jgi:predicted RNase H-like HicB family nuclease
LKDNEMKNEFTAVLEPAEEGGYFAYCPEVPEANGQGETREETLDSLREAIALVLEDRREQGLRGISGDADTTVLTVG